MAGMTLAEMTAEIREVNIALGWRSPDGGICEGQTFGDYIALLHSEVAEALEAYRDHRLADATAKLSDLVRDGGEHDFLVPGQDYKLSKPEGVGSELADVLIRLVDMADVWRTGSVDLDLTLAEVADLNEINSYDLRSFGDWMSWLHLWVNYLWLNRTMGRDVLRALVTTARHFGIDLEAEYRRKVAFNRTRPYQHAGRTLAGDK